MIKKAYLGEFRNLLSVLRQASLNNKSCVIFRRQVFKNVEMLDQLKAGGLIDNFQYRENFLIIQMKQTYWKSFILPIHALLEVESVDGRLRKNRSAKNIEKNQIRQGHFVLNSITTSKGVVTGFEAAAKKIGGIPLLTAY